MAQSVPSADSNQIYDPHFGFYVKKLTADSTIPVLKKMDGAIWTPVYTIPNRELSLVHLLEQEQIPTYYPIRLSCGKKAKGLPFFPGVLFSALNKEKRAIITNQLFVQEIMNINDRDTEELVFADMIFMNMAERISRFYPFSYEKELPMTYDSKDQVMPMTINGFGDCRIIGNEKKEELHLFFNFKTLNQILKFDLSLYQFRSLLLSKILWVCK